MRLYIVTFEGKRAVDGIPYSHDALGYAEFVDEDPRPQDLGVTRHDRARAAPGVNVYCANYAKEVRFLDMEGRVLDRLQLPDRNPRAGCLAKPLEGTRTIVVNAAGTGWLIL